MSQAGQDREGAFCTGLLTVCFLLHFLVELDGLNVAGPIYSMQSVLSEHFESRIINLPEYANYTKSYEAEAAKVAQEQASSTSTSAEAAIRRAALEANPHLRGMMTINDVTSVEHLPTFTRFVFDLVYPKARESSRASPYFSHHSYYTEADCKQDKSKATTTVETDPSAKKTTPPAKTDEATKTPTDPKKDTAGVPDSTAKGGGTATSAPDPKAKATSSTATTTSTTTDASKAKDAKTDLKTEDKSSSKTGTAGLPTTDPNPEAAGDAGKATKATPKDEKKDACAGIPAGTKCTDGDMTFLAEFNYFCGMKINVREAAMAANTDEQSRRVISDVKPADFDRDAQVDYTGSLLRHIDAAAAKDSTAFDAAQEALVKDYWKDTAPAD